MMIKRSSHIIALSLTAILLMSCSDASLYKGQLNAQATSQINFCTTPAQNIVTNLKYLFVIDHSGSNQQNYIPNGSGGYTPDPAGGTDPTGSVRFTPLINFLNSITDNANTYYASISFADAPTTTLNWTNSGVRTTNAQAIAFFQSQIPPNDGGNTDYIDTLNSIQAMITADIQAEQTAAQQGAPIVTSDYVVIWVSDGAPYVNGTLQATTTIYGDVASIMGLRTSYPDYVDSITISTGYYTTITPSSEQQTAETIMSTMATDGQGSFINFATTGINYSKFTVPARTQKFVVKDFWIQNASTVWWNGQLMLDTDNDGLPDTVEAQLGSNPNVYDSDGNGVGDGVEYYLNQKPCKDAKCSSTNANSYQVGCGAMPTGGYLDTDNDFLNNCEETLLGSKFDDFDSNVDWVPDQFEFASKVSFVNGTNNLTSIPQNDGLTNYQKMKENLPINYPATSIHGVNPLTYQLVQTSDNTSQTCYNVNVQNLATMSSADKIRVYIMESRGATGTVRRMRVAQKAVSGGNLVLSDSDFSQ